MLKKGPLPGHLGQRLCRVAHRQIGARVIEEPYGLSFEKLVYRARSVLFRVFCLIPNVGLVSRSGMVETHRLQALSLPTFCRCLSLDT